MIAAEAVEAARAAVPETADGYQFEVTEDLKRFIPQGDADPAVKSVRDFAKAQGWQQGRFEDVMGSFKALTEAGVLAPPLDFKAETARLGDTGPQRQSELETYTDALLARGDITEGEAAQMKSLLPVADGVTLLEKIRAMSQNTDTKIDPPAAAADPVKTAQDEAKALRRDERYGKDHDFTKAADKAFIDAYSKK